MNQEPLDKPVRQLVEMLHRDSEMISPTPRGVARSKMINRITFIAAVVTLVLCTGALLAMIWEELDIFMGLRFIGSVLVLFSALMIFRGINSQFAE